MARHYRTVRVQIADPRGVRFITWVWGVIFAVILLVCVSGAFMAYFVNPNTPEGQRRLEEQRTIKIMEQQEREREEQFRRQRGW